ncbi:MAG: NUDIX domain-containing protein [Euryarchaeota archaeon]|nr:NUDIX domain-containing protein [Euryarchaeota archaeon]
MCSHKVVIGIVMRGREFLMVFNPRRGWEFPGGRVEPGEQPEDAVQRELLEEAGVVGRVLSKIYEDSNLVVYLVKFEKFSGEGEFESRFFKELPEPLAFSDGEARLFLKIAFQNAISFL